MRPLLLGLFAALLLPVTASAAGLTDPVRAGDAAAGDAAIGLLPDGTAGIATVGQVNGTPRLRVAVRPPGGAWGAPVDLGPVPNDAVPVTPVVRAGGRLTFAFARAGGGIDVAQLPAGAAAWTTTPVAADGSAPALAGSPAGFAVAWRTASNGVAISRAGADGQPAVPQVVPGAADVNDVAAGFGADGVATLLWSQTASTSRVLAARRAAGESFASGTPVELATRTNGGNPFPTSYGFGDVAVADTGGGADLLWTAAAYSFPAVTSIDLDTARLAANGDAGGVVTLDDVDGTAGASLGGVSVVADDSGRSTATWSTSPSGAGRVPRGAIRPAGTGAFGGPVDLGPSAVASPPALAASGADALVLVGADAPAPASVVRRVGDAFLPARPLENDSLGPFGVGGDGRGQFALAYQRADAGAAGSWTRFLDTVGPIVSATATAVEGPPVTFRLTATATDPLSAVGPVAWAFGDGTTGEGAVVDHRYDVGQFAPTASVTDAAGNVGTASTVVLVGAPVGAAPPAPPVATPVPPRQAAPLQARAHPARCPRAPVDDGRPRRRGPQADLQARPRQAPLRVRQAGDDQALQGRRGRHPDAADRAAPGDLPGFRPGDQRRWRHDAHPDPQAPVAVGLTQVSGASGRSVGMRSPRSLLLGLLLVLLWPAAASAAGLTDPLSRVDAGPAPLADQAVGLLPDGTAGAAHVDAAGTLLVGVRAPGGAWDAPMRLDDPTAGAPQIVRAGDRLLLVHERPGSDGGVALAELPASATEWVDRGVVGAGGSRPAIAAGTDGSVAVAWLDGGGEVLIARARPGGALGDAQPVAGSSGALAVGVGVAPDGTATVLWTARDSADTRITRVLATRRGAGEAFAGGPAPIELDSGTDAYRSISTLYRFSSLTVAAGADATDLLWVKTVETRGYTVSTALRHAQLSASGTPGDVADLDSASTLLRPGVVPETFAADADVDASGRTTAVWTRTMPGAGVARAAVREPGATTFGAPQTVAESAQSAALTTSGDESLILVDASPAAEGTEPAVAVRVAGAGVTDPLELEAGAGGPLAVGGDGRGQYVLGYGRDAAVWTRFYDAVAPLVTADAEAIEGPPATFRLTATATDPLSPVGPVGWAFGDTATGEGSPVEHRYGVGVFEPVASVADAAGNVATASTTVRVGEPDVIAQPEPSPSVPPVRPRLSDLALTRRGVRVRLSADADVVVTARRRTCKRVRGTRRCRVARRSTTRGYRAVTAGTRTLGLKLRRGSYWITVRATNPGGSASITRALRRPAR